jgi:hypothetical protein
MAKRQSSFWVSYSDLATGMMIVFMLVMLLMVAIQQLKEEQRAEERKREKQEHTERQEAVQAVVNKLQIILGTKPKFAETIKDGLRQASQDSENLKDLEVDPVTAQLKIQENQLKFGSAQKGLGAKSREFLIAFTPAYICALWEHEHTTCTRVGGAGCSRLNPLEPRRVRRIMVTGSADLQGNFEANSNLSSQRAFRVVRYMYQLLEKLKEGKIVESNGMGAMLPLSFPNGSRCADHADEVWHYARERLWAVGAGDTQHCSFALNATGEKNCNLGASERVDEIRNNPDFRVVTFELELTGDDMTGFLMNVLDLMAVVGTSTSDQAAVGAELFGTAQTVAEECWKKAGAYHGCEDVARYCLGEQKPHESAEDVRIELERICEGFWKAVRTTGSPARELKERLCAEVRRGAETDGKAPPGLERCREGDAL